MGNTALPHWVVTRGRHWLALKLPCRPTVTKKGSMSQVEIKDILKRGSDSLETTKTVAVTVTPESGLVLEDYSMTPTLVETKQHVGS